MSKTLRHGAVACVALCAATAGAQTHVQIYGRLNVSAEYVKASATADGPRLSQARVSNNRSVLGFRGSEDLGDGLKLIFQLEGSVSPDTGAGEIARRDTRIGLDGHFGTLFVGHWVTAYNGATSGLDPFYPTTAGYMSIMGNGAGPAVDNVSNISSFDRRQANCVVTFRDRSGPGWFKGGHNDWTGNMVICLEARRRCVVMLANDVRAERIYPEIARLALGENDMPWRWEYGWYGAPAGK